jgi:DNA repair protein RadA/Sms
VGLGGELRAVNRIDQRISEAEKLGFTEIYVSKYHQKALKKNAGKIQVRALGRLDEVLQALI